MSPDPRRSARQIELSKRSGEFLTQAYKRQRLTRAEAAAKAGLTPGYLQSALAGRFVMPKPDVLRRMADAWGFNPIEFFLANGSIAGEDLEEWIKDNPPPLQDHLQGIASRLDAMPPEKRDRAVAVILSLLDIAISGS